MDDLISRQAAIEALGEKPLAWTEGEYELGLQNQWQSDVDALNGLPSAQPERKKGKWINRSLNILYPEWERYTCSVCGEHSNRYDYCPNCGAKMEGREP